MAGKRSGMSRSHAARKGGKASHGGGRGRSLSSRSRSSSRSSGQGRGWYGDSEGHAEAGRKGGER